MFKLFKPSETKLGTGEFITLSAMLCALGAFATDAVLPALVDIREYFALENSNQAQLVIGLFFLGLALGSVFFGPLSDSIGRKKALSLGLGLFLLGSLISLVASDLNTLLVSRIIQGFGAASTRIVVNAIIRDRFKGRMMAKVNSLIASVFIMVPVIAPFAGQMILNFFHWRVIFFIFILITMILGVWFLLRQRETLKPQNKIPFNLTRIIQAVVACVREPQTFGYALAGGFTFSILLVFLVLCPQVLKDIYLVGDRFSYYFALVALSMGLSSIINSRMVMRLGMIYLSNLFITVIIASSTAMFIYLRFVDAIPPIYVFIAYMMLTFFSLGMIFGNFLALSLQKVGHIAGVASSLVTSLSLLIAFLVSFAVGQLYDDSIAIIPLAYFLVSLSAKILIFLFQYRKPIQA